MESIPIHAHLTRAERRLAALEACVGNGSRRSRPPRSLVALGLCALLIACSFNARPPYHNEACDAMVGSPLMRMSHVHDDSGATGGWGKRKGGPSATPERASLASVVTGPAVSYPERSQGEAKTWPSRLGTTDGSLRGPHPCLPVLGMASRSPPAPTKPPSHSRSAPRLVPASMLIPEPAVNPWTRPSSADVCWATGDVEPTEPSCLSEFSRPS